MNFSYKFRKAMIKPENDGKAEDVTRPTLPSAATEASIDNKIGGPSASMRVQMVERYKNGSSLKKTHFTTQTSKRPASHQHSHRGNNGWSDRGSRNESGIGVPQVHSEHIPDSTQAPVITVGPVFKSIFIVVAKVGQKLSLTDKIILIIGPNDW